VALAAPFFVRLLFSGTQRKGLARVRARPSSSEVVRQPWEHGLLRLKRIGVFDHAHQHGNTDGMKQVACLKLDLRRGQRIAHIFL
jgi:hypothetical protein